MADETDLPPEPAPLPEPAPGPPAKTRRWPWFSLTLLGGLLLLVAAVAGGLRWIDTEGGHRFIASKIGELRPASGLRITIGGIEGSILKRMTLRDIRFYDPQGEFARIETADMRWYPLAWMNNRLDIDWLHIPAARLQRLPRLKSTGQKTSILPGFDIRLMDLRLGRLDLGAAVAGKPHRVTGRGRLDIRSGRAVVDLKAFSLDSADGIRLALDSRPDDKRFDLDAVAAAPAGGIIANLLGIKESLGLAARGAGDWKSWRGRMIVLRDRQLAANVAITVRDGRYALSGPIDLIGPLRALGSGQSGGKAQIAADLGFANRVIDGTASLSVRGLRIGAQGGVDLGRNRFDELRVEAAIADLRQYAPALTGRNVLLRGRLAGPFASAQIEYLLTAPEIRQGSIALTQLRLSGEGRLTREGGAWPMTLTAASLRTGTPAIDARLRNLNAQGLVRFADGKLILAPTKLRSSGLTGRLDGEANLSSGALAFNLGLDLRGLELSGLGRLDATTVLKLAKPAGRALDLSGTARVALQRLDNSFLRSIGGGLPVINTGLSLGPNGQINLRDLRIVAPLLTLNGQGYRMRDGSVHLTGSGEHRTYGPVSLTLDGRIERPRVALTLARPSVGLRLTAVEALLEPNDDGFAVTARGQSILGAFTADGAILLPRGAPTLIQLNALHLGDILASGTVTPVTGGLEGQLKLSGPAEGGLVLSMADGVQNLALDVDLGNARFTGAVPIQVTRGRIRARVALVPDATSIEGDVQARGVRFGSLRIGRLTGSAKLVNGAGAVQISATAQNGRLFDLNAKGDVTPDRVSVALSGTIERQPVRLSGPAVIQREADGWRLQPVTMTLRGGTMRLAGFLGAESTHLEAQARNLPLALADMANEELGLGGTADGTLSYDQPRGGVPSGKIDLRIHGLTRSGLALSSTPIDIGVNGVLNDQRAAFRAVIADGGKIIGRAQALLAPLGPGSLMQRLNAAPLQAQLRYAGNAETLWRLTNIELFTLGGRLNLSANVGGTLADPQISGTLATQDATLQSPVTGLTLRRITASGQFNGSELRLANLKGETAGGGTASGNALFTFSGERGIGMDINLQTQRAVVLDRDDVGATVTGPIRIRSSGSGGVISGNLDVVQSRFMLGRASAVAEIPQLRVIEINRQGEEVEAVRASEPWRLDITAKAAGGLRVEGLGMESEWSAGLQITGAVTSPVFKGTATLIEGSYDFAGKRFDLREGRLTFQGATPVNPLLDIRAVADVSDVDATINVTGSSLRPIISFTSTSGLPQDELLSRLLFGTSITNLSAPEAIQLASAVAAFQGGGGGLDPINAVRKATGLSRLRILPADTTTGQKTSIAAGKNITRHLYVELITDGQGYSATRVEYQITRWLALLSSVSSIGRQSISGRVSKDY